MYYQQQGYKVLGILYKAEMLSVCWHFLART